MNNKKKYPKPNIKSIYYSIILGFAFVGAMVWFKYYDLRNYGKYAVATVKGIDDSSVYYHFSWKNKTYHSSQNVINSSDFSKGDYLVVIHSTRFPRFNNIVYVKLQPTSIHKRIDTMKVDKDFITWRRIFFD